PSGLACFVNAALAARESNQMRKEWLGILVGLAIAGGFSACESDDNNTNTQSSTSSPSSSSTGTRQGGDGGTGAAAGQAGAGNMGGGPAGGAGGCNSVPQPMGSLNE